jgi:hypothetical protein
MLCCLSVCAPGCVVCCLYSFFIVLLAPTTTLGVAVLTPLEGLFCFQALLVLIPRVTISADEVS